MFSLAMLAFLHSNPPIATSTPSTLLACRYKCKWVLSLAPYAPKSFRSNPLTYLPELVFTILWCRCSGRKTRSRSPHPRVPSRANLGFEAPLVFESPHTTSPQPLNQRPLSPPLSLSLSLSLCLSSALLPWLKVVGKNQRSRGWGPRRDLSVPYFGLGPNWG